MWLDDEFNRAAMIETGGAALTFDIIFANIESVSRALARTTNEIYLLVADDIWHRELKKKEVL